MMLNRRFDVHCRLSLLYCTSAFTGQDLAPPASAAALQLALDEAQAWACLGDHAQAAGARHQAALTSAMLPAAAS